MSSFAIEGPLCDVRLDCADWILRNVDVRVAIAGYGNSTLILSLLQAFEGLDITAVLPALKSKLLNSASLEGMLFTPPPLDLACRLTLTRILVLLTTGHENNIAHATVSLANPFTSGLEITHVASNVTYQGINLGTIQTATNFSSPGKATSASPALDLDMNLDPQSLFTVTRLLAQQAGLDTAQLDAIVQLGGYHYLDTSGSANANAARDVEIKRADNGSLFK